MSTSSQASLVVPMSSAWAPGESVTDHLGKATAKHCDFFIPPPKELGPVVSANSDVKVGKALWSIPVKVAGALLMTGAVFVVAWAIFSLRMHKTPETPRDMGGAIAGLFAIVALFLAFKPKLLTYVGRDGAAIYSTRGNRAYAAPRIIRFADIANVDAHTKVRESRSVSTTYAYDYRFLDPAGQERLRLKGEYIDSIKGHHPRHQYDFAVATASAWKRAANG